MTVDVIIVGQGIAGSLLAHELEKRGKTFVIYDKGHMSSSTAVSSGLINPITGRNYVKSWMIDDFLPVAITIYQEISSKIDTNFVGNKPVIRGIHTPKDENQWHSRLAMDGYGEYISEDYDGPEYDDYLREIFQWGSVKQSCNIHTQDLLSGLRAHYAAIGVLREEPFLYEDIVMSTSALSYQGIVTEHIVFCDGAQVVNNPYFNWLPFRPAKGEVVIVRIPGFPDSHIVKHHKFLVPLGDDIFWIGSTYEWEFKDGSPSAAKRDELVGFLERYLRVSYEVIDHRAAVRPSTKYRRPFVGEHPEHERLLIFNGLGTKGISIGPYWAEYLCGLLYDGVHIHSELPKIAN